MIGVIGAGSWGSALASVLARNSSQQQFIYGRDTNVVDDINSNHANNKYLPDIVLPLNLKASNNLQEVVLASKDILLSVPSSSFPTVLLEIKQYLIKGQRLIWVTKGLEYGSACFLSEVVTQIMGKDFTFAMLSGPSFAKEVANNMPTAVVVASSCPEFAKYVQQEFINENFRVYLSDDLLGVQLGGVMKNIFAVAAGISDGLGYGANARAALITRAIAEMLRLGHKIGARAETIMGLSGVGDLILTCTDNQSRNRRYGLALANNKSKALAQQEIGQVVEALYNCVEINRLAAQHAVDMPITQEILSVLDGSKTIEEAVHNLMQRKPRQKE